MDISRILTCAFLVSLFGGTAIGADSQGRRGFWSFQPVDKPAVPEVRAKEWVRNPVDAFVLAKLESRGWEPAPVAGKRVLLRRTTQNLIGLPPTIEEVQNFLGDDSQDAFAKLVDRLLDSPQYGVRWGRHWLDVARYADSNGLDENLGYGHAWRFRDYVIDSFNADKPFDRFIVEQIAGDLLPLANQETRTATGFLVLGAKVLAEPDKKKLEMDIIDEQIDTIGKAFLGMSLGCVRCHDHKSDPFTQKDYYALAAIFKGTETLSGGNRGNIQYWNEHSFATEEEEALVKAADEELDRLRKAAASFKSKEVVRLRGEARAKAAEYLAAAAKFSKDAPLTEVKKIAAPEGLHPWILHHCRLHLDYHRRDPFFAEWHKLAQAKDFDGIRGHYGTLFKDASDDFAKARKADPKATSLEDPTLEAARAALFDNFGFLAVPSIDAFAFDEATLEEYYGLLAKAREYETAAPDLPSAMGVGDGETVPTLAVHIRGSYKDLGEPVPRAFPAILRYSSVPPVFPAKKSGRLELANWLADTRNPLAARVIVNRIWGWHFGQGLVDSTENFGKLGGRPSHPELLDWLAYEFMANGWSVKHINRVILNSNAYQMAAAHPQDARYQKEDPLNRFLWKANLRRLDAEQLRDSILAVSGLLDTSLGGKTLPLRNRQFVFNHTSEDHTKYDSPRRAVYLPVIRNHLYSLFEQFDFPDPTMPTGSRNTTSIPTQALVLMNSPLVMDSAQAFAQKLMQQECDPSKRIALAYQTALGRLPSGEESALALGFTSGKEGSLALFCQSLLSCNEFLYLQ